VVLSPGFVWISILELRELLLEVSGPDGDDVRLWEGIIGRNVEFVAFGCFNMPPDCNTWENSPEEGFTERNAIGELCWGVIAVFILPGVPISAVNGTVVGT